MLCRLIECSVASWSSVLWCTAVECNESSVVYILQCSGMQRSVVVFVVETATKPSRFVY